MPEQLKRLIPLFALFILIFLIVRYLLLPDSFGQFGHYRGDALIDNQEKEIVYATDESCVDCHSDIAEMLEMDLHSELSCMGCHGPGLKHSLDPENEKVEKHTDRKFCGSCHMEDPARPTNMVFQVNIHEHHMERTLCIDCHNPHAVWELKE